LRVIGKAEVDGKFQYTASGTLTDKKPAIVNSSGQAEQVFSTIQQLGDRVFASSNNVNFIASCYDSNSNRIVYVYQDVTNNTYGTAVVGEIIGDTISFGTPVVFNSSANTANINCEFNSTNNKIFIIYVKSPTSYGRGRIGTVDPSDNSISFGAETQWENEGGVNTVRPGMTYHSNGDKMVVTYREGGSDIKIAMLSASGTTMALEGSLVDVSTAGGDAGNVSLESTSGTRGFVSYFQNSPANAHVKAYTISGTTITLSSSAYQFNAGSTSDIAHSHDPRLDRTLICYKDGGNNGYGTIVPILINGTGASASVTVGSEFVFASQAVDQTDTAYDIKRLHHFIFYRDAANDGRVQKVLANLTASPASVNTGSVSSISMDNTLLNDGMGMGTITYDSTNNKLFCGEKYTAQDGPAARILVPGDDYIGARSQIAATSSGNNCAIVHDTNADRVVIFYKDSNDNNYTKARVGTCTATGITALGTPVTAIQQNGTYHDATFDSSTNRVVLVVSANSTNYTNVGVVDPSDNSITFGGIQQLDANQNSPGYNSIVFETVGNRVVIGYKRFGGDSKVYFKSGVVNTGTNQLTMDTALGSPVDPGFGGVNGGVAMSYHPTHQGILVAYSDTTNNNYGTANVLKYDAGSATKLNIGTDFIFQSASVTSVSVESETRYGRNMIQYKRDSNGYGEARGALMDVPNSTVAYGGSGYYYTGTGTPLGLRYIPHGDIFAMFHRDGSNKLFYSYWKFKDGKTINDFIGTSLSSGATRAGQFTDYRWFNHYAAALMAPWSGSIYHPTHKKTYCLVDDTVTLYGQILDTSETNLKASNFIGFSDGTYTNGQSATIQNGGIISNQSNLTPGKTYYLYRNGNLNTISEVDHIRTSSGTGDEFGEQNIAAGIATSATELLVKG